MSSPGFLFLSQYFATGYPNEYFFLDILLDILLLDTVLRDFLLYLLLNILGLNIEYFASGYPIQYNFLAVPLKSEIE